MKSNHIKIPFRI